MTTTVYYTGSIATTQDLYTITSPVANLPNLGIANVSKATTAVVTTSKEITGDIVNGTAVLISGVGGMTQLKTNGVDGTSKYFVDVLTPTTFGLYTDAELTANVDSSSFSNATSNTGAYATFSVPQYNSVASPAVVVFDTSGTSSGTQISLDETTGYISLQGGSDYVLSAVVNTTRTFPQTSTAGYQWYDVINEIAIGPFVKFGETCTAIYTSSGIPNSPVVLRVFSDTETFEYPNQLFDASFNVQLSVPV